MENLKKIDGLKIVTSLDFLFDEHTKFQTTIKHEHPAIIADLLAGKYWAVETVKQRRGEAVRFQKLYFTKEMQAPEFKKDLRVRNKAQIERNWAANPRLKGYFETPHVTETWSFVELKGDDYVVVGIEAVEKAVKAAVCINIITRQEFYIGYFDVLGEPAYVKSITHDGWGINTEIWGVLSEHKSLAKVYKTYSEASDAASILCTYSKTRIPYKVVR